MEYFKILPLEITLDILSRLPTESVLECKSVCRNWRILVSQNPLFSKMHFNHHLNHPGTDSGKLGFIALSRNDLEENEKYQYFEYNVNHESVERIRRLNFNPPFGDYTNFVDSCNGLICLTGSPYVAPQTVCIWNSITRECIMLPEIKGFEMSLLGTGFGYVSSTKEYKVVRLMSENCTTEFMEVQVYTLGSGLGWRNLGKFNYRATEYWEVDGIFSNGALYWLDYELEMIVPFDLAEEKFCEHLSPPLQLEYDDDGNCYGLGVLDGCLSFVILKIVDGAPFRIIWLLKKKNDNYDMKEREQHHSMGWSEEFRGYDNIPFAVTKSCDVLRILTYRGHHINIHDPVASTSKRIVDFKFEECLVILNAVFPHKNTLVSLKEIGEEDTKIMESV